MQWRIAGLILVMAGTAWGQTTRPASNPSVVAVRLDYLNSLRAEVDKLRDEVSRLTRENAKLKAVVEKPIDEKIAAAIKEGRLAVGMTLAEAETAMKRHDDGFLGSKLIRESSDAKFYEFTFPGQSAGAQYFAGEKMHAWFRDGKIIEWSK